MADHDELLDAIDDLGRALGPVPRSEIHERGLWHRVFHCLIVSDRGGGSVVLQRRAATKAAFAGRLDLSATGHLAAGERPVDGLRELAEELGVEVAPSALVPLGERHLVDDNGEGRWNRELVSVFLVRDDRPLSAYLPDPREVDAVVDVPVDAALELFAGDRSVLPVHGIDADGRPMTLDLSIDHLVPGDGYWITLLVMARRLLDGARPLAI